MFLYKNTRNRFWLFISLGLVMTGCGSSERLDTVLKNKTLTVVTRNAPTTWYEDRDGPAGFEYELVNEFANSLGVELKVMTKDSISEIIEELGQGKADIAAAGLTRTVERENGFIFGPEYYQVRQQVVCRRGGARPKTVDDLIDVELMVPADSSYVEKLEQLKEEHSGLSWQVDETLNTESLLESVWQKKLECTIADSNIVAVNRRYLPELSVRFDISEPESLAWMLPNNADGLNDALDDWFGEDSTKEFIEALREKYYGHIETFDFVDTRSLTRRIKRVLPKYKKTFMQGAGKYKIDWTLLAAQSYQESHWNPRAKSPTGVRGMMMLTLPTARELGVESRLDATSNIIGGAKYFSQLRKRLPDKIEGEDRDWIALAAYNVGFGHLLDAFKLAEQLEKNPYLWRELQEVMPLLSQKKYYKNLKYGYARGREPVRYVQRVRDYQDIIKQHLGEKNTESKK